MYCASSKVLHENLILRCAAPHPYFSAINKSYNKNNPKRTGFCVRPNCGILLTIFKEDYYV